MNWADLQILLAFEREGTLQKTAAKLGIDISTVSRRVRVLETDLGSKVVENIGGRLVLTSYGEKAARAAEHMEIESYNLQREAKGKDTLLSGVLRVALLDLFTLFHSDLLKSFTNHYPQVTLELISGTTRLHNLSRREADVAIRMSKIPYDTLVGIRALHTEYAVYAHQAMANCLTADWKKLPWIGWDLSANAYMIDNWMEKYVPAEQVRFRFNSPVSQFIMVEAGAGACILPTVYAEKNTNLVRLSGVLEGFDTDMWLLTHRDLRRNARVQTFLDYLYKGLEPDRSRAIAFEAETSC